MRFFRWLLNLFRKLFRRRQEQRVEVEPYGDVKIVRRIKRGTRRIRQRAEIVKRNRRTTWVRLSNNDVIIRKNRDVVFQ